MRLLGRGLRGASALAACAVALASAPAANAAVTCTYDNSDRVTVTMSADNDGAIVAVLPGGAIAVRGGGPVLACPGAGGPPTVTNTDFVIVNDTSGGGDTRLAIHEPASFAPGLTATGEAGTPEIEFVLAPGTGTNDSLFVSGTPGPDNWVLGATGFNWNGDADSEFFATSPTAFDSILLDTGDGDDVISAQGGPGVGAPLAGAGFLELAGAVGSDTLSGSNKAAGDLIRGLDGNDTISGFEGDDQLIPGVGDDAVAGGAGTDTLNYLSTQAPVTVDLSQTAAQVTGEGTDSLATIENVLGSAFSDTLIGNAGANVLNGSTGNNTFDGREGADQLTGSIGVDTVDLRAGAHRRHGQPDHGRRLGRVRRRRAQRDRQRDRLRVRRHAHRQRDRERDHRVGRRGHDKRARRPGHRQRARRRARHRRLRQRDRLRNSRPADPGRRQRGLRDGRVPARRRWRRRRRRRRRGGGVADTVISVRWSIAGTQRVLKQHALLVKVRCPTEACRVVAGAKLGRLKLKRVSRQIPAGVTRTLKLRYSKRQRLILGTRLAAGRHPVLKVTARATDAAGNRVTRTRRVKTKA